MKTRRQHRTRTPDHRRLIHLLNQRYHQEFIRAERLAADLALLQRFRATWLFRALHCLRSLFRASRRPPPQDFFSTPLSLQSVEVSGRVSVIIPFRDQDELLRKCLASLRQGTYRDYEIVLVDNGSRDPALLRLLRKLEGKARYRVIRDPRPFNFSSLCNAGAAAASGDWLLFLNNDTCVLTPDWMEQMIRAARQPGVGVVGAALYYPDGTVQHSGILHGADGIWEHDRQEVREVSSVPAVTAACLMIGRQLFEELRGFDEARPVTHNDVDLCRRARAKGHLVAVTPHARLLHYESLSRGYTLTDVI